MSSDGSDSIHEVKAVSSRHKEHVEESYPHPDTAVIANTETPDLPKWVRFKTTWWVEGLSEFMGTFVMILFGDGVVAQTMLSKNTAGDYQSISWAWG